MMDSRNILGMGWRLVGNHGQEVAGIDKPTAQISRHADWNL